MGRALVRVQGWELAYVSRWRAIILYISIFYLGYINYNDFTSCQLLNFSLLTNFFFYSPHQSLVEIGGN